MIIQLLTLFLFAVLCQTQTVYRSSVKGDLVSISGDGNVIAIFDIGSNALTILKKSGLIYTEIKVQNAHIWIPTESSLDIRKSENMKHFKPQLS